MSCPTRTLLHATGSGMLLAMASTAQIDWTLRTRTLVSDGPGAVAAATDAVTGRAVLCGANTQQWLGTWEWDGTQWVLQGTQGPPGHGLAWYWTHAVTTGVGGHGLIRFSGIDTWAWNSAASTWTRLAPAHSPPRMPGTMCCDPVRGRIVLLNWLGETWLWDGTDWQQATVTVTPPGPLAAALAHDPLHGRLVLFGGQTWSGTFSNETWEWTGSDWLQRTPGSAPPDRVHAGLGFDPIRQRLILHGGVGRQANGQFVYRADTWEWDGLSWAPVAASGPPALGRATLVEDRRRQRLLLVGNGPDDAYEWTGAQWQPIGPGARPVAGWYGQSLAFDRIGGQILCFGGGTQYAAIADSWAWDGQAWRRLSPTTSPPARMWATLVPTHGDRLLLFGGAAGGSPSAASFSDLWEWTGSDWSQRAVGISPPARNRHAAAYDPQRGRLVLFGGTDNASVMADTWEWDGAAWTQRPGPGPQARRGHGMAWHGGRGRIVLFGGGDTSGGFLADTWEWDGFAWQQLPVATSPSPRRSFQMIYDPHRDRCVLSGGFGPAGDVNDLWEFDTSGWLPRPTSAVPDARAFAALAYDPDRRQTVLFGGLRSTSAHGFAETWTLAPLVPASALPFGQACPGSGGMPELRPMALELPWLGTRFGIRLAGLGPASGAAFLLLGASRTQWGTVPLPLDLTPAGMPGCSLNTDPIAIDGPLSRAAGSATWSAVLPANGALAGLRIYLQAIVADPSANAQGLVLSNALELSLGTR